MSTEDKRVESESIPDPIRAATVQLLSPAGTRKPHPVGFPSSSSSHPQAVSEGWLGAEP